MSGLMYYRPEDHIAYLLECLQKLQDQGVTSVKWNQFIDLKRKSPLPPISSTAPDAGHVIHHHKNGWYCIVNNRRVQVCSCFLLNLTWLSYTVYSVPAESHSHETVARQQSIKSPLPPITNGHDTVRSPSPLEHRTSPLQPHPPTSPRVNSPTAYSPRPQSVASLVEAPEVPPAVTEIAVPDCPIVLVFGTSLYAHLKQGFVRIWLQARLGW